MRDKRIELFCRNFLKTFKLKVLIGHIEEKKFSRGVLATKSRGENNKCLEKQKKWSVKNAT